MNTGNTTNISNTLDEDWTDIALFDVITRVKQTYNKHVMD